jgi:hypothetical protein
MGVFKSVMGGVHSGPSGQAEEVNKVIVDN